MNDDTTQELLAHRFEADRTRLRGVAYRMLGSTAEAEDAVQEAWLRLARAETGEVENLSGWLTTVVARVCLDQLRSRKSRREDPVGVALPEDEPAAAAGSGALGAGASGADPAHEAELADSVGLALLVVLDTLSPAERLAFVLHDLFAVSFDEIAPIVDRTPAAARQLASRARRRVQQSPRADGEADRSRQRTVVDAFLAASRGGDFEALLTVLDPQVVFRGDEAAVSLGGPVELRGAQAVAASFCGRAHAAFPALLDGEIGMLVVPKPGRVLLALRLSVADGRITGIQAVAERAALDAMDLVQLEVRAHAPAADPLPARGPAAGAGRNRAKVLEAARAAFAAEGLAVPLDEIARRAGVGAGTVYRHFPTKEALFEAVVADRLDALAADAEARLDAADPGAAFFAFFLSMVEVADEKKDLADALTASGVGLSPATLASAARLQAGLDALLGRAREVGAIRDGITVADLHALAIGALAAEHRAAAEPGHVRGRLTRLICDGLRR